MAAFPMEVALTHPATAVPTPADQDRLTRAALIRTQAREISTGRTNSSCDYEEDLSSWCRGMSFPRRELWPVEYATWVARE